MNRFRNIGRASTEAPKAEAAPKKKRTSNLAVRSFVERRNVILRYIKDMDGKRISTEDIAELVGYSSPSSANHALRDMVREDLIERIYRGPGRGHTYKVRPTRIVIPPKETTEPAHYIPTKPTPMPQLEAEAEENISRARYEAAKSKKTLEDNFLRMVDTQITAFLLEVSGSKDAFGAGHHLNAMSDFSTYLHAKLEKNDAPEAEKAE